jgi:acetyl esterase/lipase
MFRLLVFIFFLLLSLLAVFIAPMRILWYLSIIVTEFPWIFLLIVTALLFWRFGSGRYETASIIIGVLSLLLFAFPLIGAYHVVRSLNKDLYHALPVPVAPGTPYRFWKMFASGGKSIPYQTMRYNDSAKYPLSLDFYPAQAAGARPCVVVVHGGGWSNGDSRQLPELNSHLAKAGYNVASVNYRMAPSYHFPAPVEDVQTAINYLRSNAVRLNIDSNNFVLLGRSAGGQIALIAAYTLNDPGLKGVISYYGPTDMVWGYAHPANPLVLNSRGVVADYLGGSYQAVPKMYDSSSAIQFVNGQTLPTLLIHGQHDPLVAYDNSSMLSKKLAQNGVRHFLLTLPWATHGCDYTLKGPSGQLSTYTVERFLKSVTQ